MASTTLPGVLLKGVAASRPAANAVAAGTLYSATDTGAVTQSDGVSTWSTFLTVTAATRASLGLDTTDSPQFAGVNLGHASDTTLTRVSAGVVAIEGTNIVKAGAATGSGLTMATARLLGRTTGSTGAIEEITVGTGLSLSAGSLTATGGGGGGSISTVDQDLGSDQTTNNSSTWTDITGLTGISLTAGTWIGMVDIELLGASNLGPVFRIWDGTNEYAQMGWIQGAPPAAVSSHHAFNSKPFVLGGSATMVIQYFSDTAFTIKKYPTRGGSSATVATHVTFMKIA